MHKKYEETEIKHDKYPKEWKIEPLENLLKGGNVSYGIVQPGNHTTTGVPIVRVKDLRNGSILQTNPLRVSPEISNNYSRTRLEGGEVLLSLVGSVGETAIVPPEMEGWNVARAIAVLKPSSQISSRWIRLCLQSSFAQHHMGTRQTTTVQATLNLRDVRQIPIVIPPQDERNAITAAIGALDDKITVNERIIATQEEILSSHFENILSSKEEGTQTVQASDLVAFNPKTPKPTEDDAIYVDMAALSVERAPITTWTHRTPKSGSRFINGDTLLARITPCLENGKTGFVDFMNEGQVGVGSTEFIVMRSHPGVPPEFSYFLARDQRFRKHVIQNMAGTSGRQRASAADASKFIINKPKTEQIQRFGKDAEKAFSLAKSLNSESQTLAELRDTLLPQLMSGKLRVKDAEKIVEDNV
ncbi:restriction endonuclease subunit S [Nocardiopsis sp. CA-288880]|uniref:restriction endonuclease subunit S n=1 Tax=Nocardiopsis sp. CA-288880 TaxID=3239995 RepID=UPI003D953BF6